MKRIEVSLGIEEEERILRQGSKSFVESTTMKLKKRYLQSISNVTHDERRPMDWICERTDNLFVYVENVIWSYPSTVIDAVGSEFIEGATLDGISQNGII